MVYKIVLQSMQFDANQFVVFCTAKVEKFNVKLSSTNVGFVVRQACLAHHKTYAKKQENS